MEHRLTDLIGIDFLQKLADLYHSFTGVAAAIVDADGMLLVTSGWSSICTDFHRRCPDTRLNCPSSDQSLNQLACNMSYASSECLNGLVHYGARIKLNQHYLGSFFIGQIFHSPPDRQRFINQAQKYSFDEDSYLKALDQVKIVSPHDMERNLQLLINLIQLLGQMGMERIQRIAAQEASITSEKYLDLIVESSQDGFWIWEMGDDFIMSNRCSEIIGFSSEEFRPQPQAWLTRIHPQDLLPVIGQLEGHVAGLIPSISFEYRFLTKQGQWKWLLAKAKITSYDKNHSPAQIAGTISDITERKQVEMNLLERENLYRSLVETSPSAIVLTDISGIIKFINPQGAELFGWNDAARLIGQSGHILLHTKEWGQIGLDYRLVMAAGCHKQVEYTCVRREGTSFIAEFNIAPIYDAKHRLSGCISIVQDATSRKLMETELL